MIITFKATITFVQFSALYVCSISIFQFQIIGFILIITPSVYDHFTGVRILIEL